MPSPALPREIPGWDDYFLVIAQAVARRSKDPSTQHGAVVVCPEHSILGTGFNGPPPRFPDQELDWSRPAKYDVVRHAEINALSYARRHGRLQGCTLYVTGQVCPACMLDICGEGIIRVVHGTRRARMMDEESVRKSLWLASLGGVIFQELPGYD